MVENLDSGAVENWLLRMLRHARAQGIAVDWTFYCALGQPGTMDNEARALGARILYSPAPIGKKSEFVRALRAEIRRGRYDVLHCHHDIVSAVYLGAALGLPIAKRIVHVHNADQAVLTPGRLKQRLYREPMRRICHMLADRIVGISNHTLDTFLAGRRRRAGRDIVHYYGVDPTPFEHASLDYRAFRHQLGLPDDALIMLFAGRLVPEKSPLFAVAVLAELRQIEPRTVAVFAGTGSLKAAINQHARELGVEEQIRLIGWRSDLPEVMCCSDWFILPRPEAPMEGFGLAVVEAQLAGLRLLLSLGIPDDPLLPTANSKRLSSSGPPAAWARAAIELLNEPAPRREETFSALANSPMDMNRALKDLLALHA